LTILGQGLLAGGYEKRGNEKVLIGLEWLPVVKGWALQSQESQSLCGFQANPAFGTKLEF
jgi:hypothetical protein